MDNFTFSPPTLTVTAGTTVTWVNEDDIPHTIAAKDRSFRSKALDTDGRFSFTFKAPGEYDYFCQPHPYMNGKLIVRGQPGATPPPASGFSERVSPPGISIWRAFGFVGLIIGVVFAAGFAMRRRNGEHAPHE